jgi:hypothetical protein
VSGEAYARLRAGERLREAGDAVEAGEQLARAIAVYDDVGAVAYVARAQRYLTPA